MTYAIDPILQSLSSPPQGDFVRPLFPSPSDGLPLETRVADSGLLPAMMKWLTKVGAPKALRLVLSPGGALSLSLGKFRVSVNFCGIMLVY